MYPISSLAEADVDGHEHEAGRGHPEVRLQHGRRVGGDDGHAIEVAEAEGAEAGRQPIGPLLERAIGVAPITVDHGRLVGKHVGAPPQEADRRQLRPVGMRLLGDPDHARAAPRRHRHSSGFESRSTHHATTASDRARTALGRPSSPGHSGPSGSADRGRPGRAGRGVWIATGPERQPVVGGPDPPAPCSRLATRSEPVRATWRGRDLVTAHDRGWPAPRGGRDRSWPARSAPGAPAPTAPARPRAWPRASTSASGTSRRISPTDVVRARLTGRGQ